MEGIAAWWPAEPRRWMELRDTGGHVDPPVGMVDQSVMPAAQRNTVVDAGGAVIGPMNAMVDIAPAGRYRTPRKSAPAVSNE
ncbi:MAG: hypothetical protein DLM60_08660, partial [Pseudonocardiales bacterium]